MPLPVPLPGLVICYSYLWRDQRAAGAEEGTKDRPCAIVLTSEGSGGEIIVTVVPVTHSSSVSLRDAVPLPGATKRRLGLDDSPSWVVVSEVNRFTWPGPDLRPVSRDEPDRFAYGMLPPALFRQITKRLQETAIRQRLTVVRR